MGARSTNLVFVEKNSFWIRNVPIAGNQISQSICNEMQEPFMAAETLKKGKGFVSLGGVYADPDDADAARISKLIRSTMTRLHVDINRSIAYYRTTLNGAPPKRVFLTGGSSQLPYLDLFIADKLSLPVTYFNPLRNVNLGAGPQHGRSCSRTAATRRNWSASPCAPREAARRRSRSMRPRLAARADKRRKQPYYFGALAAWVLLFVCLSLYYVQQTQVAQLMATTLRGNTQSLETLAPRVNTLAKEQDKLQQTLKSAVDLGMQRDAWAKVLAAINDKIPDGVWITELVPVSNPAPGSAPRPGSDSVPGDVNMLVISGLYHANAKTEMVDSARLREFVNALADSPIFDIDKNNITNTLISFTTPETDPNVFAQKFSMHLKLKVPISSKP